MALSLTTYRVILIECRFWVSRILEWPQDWLICFLLKGKTPDKFKYLQRQNLPYPIIFMSTFMPVFANTAIKVRGVIYPQVVSPYRSFCKNVSWVINKIQDLQGFIPKSFLELFSFSIMSFVLALHVHMIFFFFFFL